MGLFSSNPNPYPGGMPMPVRRRSGLRTFLLVLGIILGLYFLNMAFLWVKLPVFSDSILKVINIATGVLLIILGLMTVIRQKY